MSGKRARSARQQQQQTQQQAGRPAELHALGTLIQWGILPAGECGGCGRATPDPRSLVTVMGPIPTRDARPGDPADEAAADARFCRLAEQQARGEYAIGAVSAMCARCASMVLVSVPDAIGASQAFTRRAFAPLDGGPMGTDGVFMGGEAGADKPVRWSIRSVFAGELLPKLEANCRDVAAQYLRDTPRHVFAWDDGTGEDSEARP